MMFSCCHPALTEDTQTALILRLVCGFGTNEVALAFFSEPSAMEKRLVRAKKVLADEGRLFEPTTHAEARERAAAVMQAVYLMFDAGYHSAVAPEVVRLDVASEAIRLAVLLADSRATTGPAAHALAALTCLHGARIPARMSPHALVPLEEQDRAAWDGDLVRLGMTHLSASASGSELTVFHLEAGIAAQHAAASSVETTDWQEITRLYDFLYAKKPTPVVALSRAIARSRVLGAQARGSKRCSGSTAESASTPIPSTGQPSETSRFGRGKERRPRSGLRAGSRAPGRRPSVSCFSAASTSAGASDRELRSACGRRRRATIAAVLLDARGTRLVRWCVGAIVCVVLPTGSRLAGSATFAWTMYSRATEFRIDLITTDAAGQRRSRNPTALAEHALPGTALLLGGSDHWRPGPSTTLRSHLDDLADHACRETHAAAVELTLHERSPGDAERAATSRRVCPR